MTREEQAQLQALVERIGQSVDGYSLWKMLEAADVEQPLPWKMGDVGESAMAVVSLVHSAVNALPLLLLVTAQQQGRIGELEKRNKQLEAAKPRGLIVVP